MTGLARRLVPRTLRGRLSLVALTAAALLMTILTVVFNLVMDRHLRHQADAELRDRAEAVAATVDTGGVRARVLETGNDESLDTNVWIHADGRMVEQPPSVSPDTSLSAAVARLADGGRRACVTADGDPAVRLCALPVPGGHAATVVTAMSLGPYRSSADTLLVGSLALDGVMLVCTYVLTRLSVGRALRPVRTMTAQAAQWSAVASEDRFGAERHPVELAGLGASLDALLERIRTVLRHEQRLTGELSHELRTPLTRIIIELDWWRARPRSAEETRATHEVIAEAARSMRTICDTLLDDARECAEERTAVPGTTDIVPVLNRLLQQQNPPKPVEVSLETVDPMMRAAVTPALLERILSPLLANAVRYARSRVVVSAWRTAGTVRVDVVDDGPGVPAGFVGELFTPGRRADNADGHDGAGLGLPLARRLARAAGGEVLYESGQVPGARFVVSLRAD